MKLSISKIKSKKTIQMHLHNEPFEKIKNGLKTVEGRLLDEKRKEISEGDEIVFTNRQNGETILVVITKLEKFNSFSDMFDKTKKKDWGLPENYEKKKFLDSLKKYYSSEEKFAKTNFPRKLQTSPKKILKIPSKKVKIRNCSKFSEEANKFGTLAIFFKIK